ncbi:Homocysteine S-methyltransferase 1, partial [Blyttiomyces sp. JEL0837]
LENPSAIKAVHKRYLEAGSDIITTATYQASPRSLYPKILPKYEAVQEYFNMAVDLARSAVSETGSSAKVAASMGSYGAFLADGSEYSGDFKGVSLDDLTKFHEERLRIVFKSQPDLLAFETVPSTFEAKAIVNALRKVQSETGSSIPAWISFSCAEDALTSGDSVESCCQELCGLDTIYAAGINCTKPHHVENLVRQFVLALQGTDKRVIAYPNSGETWDGKAKVWLQDDHSTSSTSLFCERAYKWAQAGSTIIGGCCRTGPMHIKALSDHFKPK